MAVYGYIRVSTEQQSDAGQSLEAQRRQLEGYAMLHDLKIDQIYTDRAVSGWKPLDSRPEGSALLRAIQPGDVVLCPKLDQMFRNSNDALSVSAELKEKTVSLHLLDLGGDVTGNGVSKVFFTILAAFAEFERDRIAQRIREVKQSQKSEGQFLGGSIPFGFDKDSNSNLIPNPEQQKIIARIVALRNTGKSLRAISELLRSEGVHVSHVTVGRILRDNSEPAT